MEKKQSQITKSYLLLPFSGWIHTCEELPAIGPDRDPEWDSL